MGLIHAVKSGKLEDVEEALNQGADVNETDEYGCTALYYAAENGFDNIAKKLLLANNIEVDRSNKYGETPLMRSISKEHNSVTQLLLARGADPNKADSNGYTSMHKAALTNDFDLIVQMRDKYYGNIEAKTVKGSTIMHCAAVGVTEHKEDWSLVRWLIGLLSDSNAVDNFNVTPTTIFEQKDFSYAQKFHELLGDQIE